VDKKIIKPVIIYAEATPNPASTKFVANIILVENGATAQYLRSEDTKGSPLAAKLFSFPFVSGIFMTSNFITITKSDAVSWEDITQEIRSFLTQYIGEGNSIIDILPTTQMPVDNTFEEKKESFTEHSSPNTEIEVKIIEVLEEHIRPAVENDGGAITFTSFIDGVVTVELRGSCSGCPSAIFTLKAGIEALLQRLIPEVKEVVAKEM
jgi:Fe-S cluster biogenesis protein NfuA